MHAELTNLPESPENIFYKYKFMEKNLHHLGFQTTFKLS